MKRHTAEERMIKTVPIAGLNDTVAEIERMFLSHAKEFETINYIYVNDESGRLAGVASIKEIFRSPKDTLIKDLMATKLITVHGGTPQERIAILALQHNLKAIPVVDKDGKLEGVVSSDTILRILHEEHVEDALRSAGIVASNKSLNDILAAPATTHFKKRIPWLVVGLAGGVAAAFMVGLFENALREFLALAAFMPAIVYIADAVGAQTGTIFIRNLAVSPTVNLKKYVAKELMLNIAIAAFLGSMMAAISFLWWEPKMLGVILGLSFFTAIIAANAFALLLPWIFLKSKIDPAIATGPFATVIRDITSLAIYFGIASFAMRIVGT